MKKVIYVFILISFLLIYGCAYRHYLGLHGPSINKYPDIHEDVKTDEQCLVCHNPGNDPETPVTSHPGFKGCFKCHSD